MTTRSYPRLMYREDRAATTDNAIIVRSGETLGGGSAVNIDLAFSPLEATVQARINAWIEDGLMDSAYSTERLADAYEWVRTTIGTRTLSESELNNDNRALWDGASAYGVDPSLYHLNRFPVGDSPSPVNDKLDAARQLIYPAIADSQNPLGLIPDAIVDEVLFDGSGMRATGVRLHTTAPWTDYGNTIEDPSELGIEPGVSVTIEANDIVLAAGTIGTTRILLNTAEANPAVANPAIGRGLILHPSFPLLGLFDHTINLLEGLDSATFCAAFGVTPGFIFETMAGLPAYGAVLIPGSGKQIYDELVHFNDYVGFGLMLVDTPSDDNRVMLDDSGETVLQYALSDADKDRFRIGVAIGIRMMFLAGAKKVIIPSNENVLGLPDFDPMVGTYLTDIGQADTVEDNIQFVPNRTILTSAHLQATNKMGPKGKGVVSLNHRLWAANGEEVPNVYVMDSSIFPTSVGANPMQSLYSIAKIFSERLIDGLPT
jgi:choline dehydrogenase-like flavoprotein